MLQLLQLEGSNSFGNDFLDLSNDAHGSIAQFPGGVGGGGVGGVGLPLGGPAPAVGCGGVEPGGGCGGGLKLPLPGLP